MIRILQILGGLDRGGAETMLMNLYRHVDKNSIQFDFIVHTEEKQAYYNEILEMGGRIFSCPKYCGRNHFQYKQWWKNFFAEHPEYKIIHSHVRSTASIIFQAAKEFEVKTIIHSHSTSNGSGLKSVVKKILQYPLRNQADCFFACSRSAGEWLYGKKLAKRKKIHIIPNAIDVEKYKVCHETRKTYREQLEINETTQVYIHVGRMHQAKNHGFLLKMFSEVLKKQPDSVLLLVGDGDLRNEIETRICELNLKEHVKMLGSREDVPALLQMADCFLLPSLWEGIPVTAIEAAAAGLPCILSDKITKDVNVTGNMKFLSLDAPVSVWVDALLHAESPDVEHNIKAIKESGYDMKSTAGYVEDIYRKLCEGMEKK